MKYLSSLRRGATLAGLVLSLASAHALADKLTFERIHADPPLSGPTARGVEVSPDGTRVTFLRARDEDQDMLDLWQFDSENGEQSLLLRQEDLIVGAVELTAEEEARRQRLRIRAGGITGYGFDDSGRWLLIPLAGNLYIYDFETESVVEIADDDARLNPVLSPDGDRVAFVRDRNIWLRNLETGDETALTESSGDAVVNGLAEFVAQEEMGRLEGFWWSPDGSRIAFLQYDEAAVHILDRVAIGGDGATLTAQRYPLAGTDNVTIRLGIIELANRETRWVDLGPDEDIYIPSVDWGRDGRRLYVQRQPRSQQRLDLLAADPSDGSTRVVLTETAASWINLHDDFRPLADGRFLWTSERSGYRHIYLYDRDGADPRALTGGDWLVDAIACVDTESEQVYFTGWRDDPLTRHLYRTGFDGRSPGRPEPVTTESGMHSIAAANDCSLYIDSFSAPDQPTQVSLHDSEGERLAWLLENRLDENHPYAPYLDTHVTPEFGSIDAADGSKLYYSLYRPSDFTLGQQYPAIVSVYGGPLAQGVQRGWGSLTAQAFADAGFVVFALDNRGSSRRGVAFESPLYRTLGDIEVRDQLAGLEYLRSLPFVDDANIGVEGWSYGGYMTLMLLAKGGDAIAAGVAGAPVTEWQLYDTHYTERYLGLPQQNASGYEQSSVFPHLDGIRGDLLLIHGMADDNVFFTNSTKLMQALQQSNMPFELMTYPGETHFIRNRASRLHADLTMLRFFERNLKE